MSLFKKFSFSFITLLTSATAFAEEKSLDAKINDAIKPIIDPFVAAIFSPMPGSEALLGMPFQATISTPTIKVR